MKGVLMRNIGFSAFLVPLVLIAMVFSGCQDGQGSGDVSKRDRLVGNENLRLKRELETCQQLVEKQKQLLADCEQEKMQIAKDSGETASFLMQELPEGLLEEVTRLRQENEKLLERITLLKEKLRNTKSSRVE